MSPRAILCILLLAGGACLFPGCLAGTAGVALGIWSAVGGEEGRPEDAPRVVNLRLLPGSEGSPRADDLEAVRVSFDLVSPSGRPARVKVEHSSGRRAATIAEMDLDASPAGRAHVVVWNAAADGLEGLVRTELAVTPRDGAGRGFGARLAGVLIGNDPPQVASVEVEGERVEKNVVVRFELSDSAGDPSRIALLVSQDGGGSFAGVPREHVPVGALERVPPGQHALTWDSEATLGRVDISGVVLAIEPDDGLAGGAGERRESSPFRADNNEPPAAVVNGASFVLNADATRGIPVPFALEDPEGDQVLAVFQWRFASQPGFPELPADRAAMEAALADPALREALQVAAEQPRELEGRLVLPDPADLARVELPEARSGAAALASSGLAGQELEVLRDGTLAVVRPPGGGLAAPVAVASLPGAAALVLDRPSEGSWRLQELDLEASRIARRIAPVEGSRAGLGSPTALALEPGGDSALVALELGKVWWVLRAGLEDGATAVLVDASAAGLLGSVRALAPLGTAAALATVGGALLRIEYAAPGSDGRAPRASVVLDGLASPWGIAVDPLHEGRVYLAERDAAGAGRVLAIDLRTLERRPLAVGGLALERPEALALAGARLLVATDEGGDGLRELRAADLGAGRPEAFELAGGLATGPGGIAAGPDGLVLAALPALGACAAGGGVAQARRICAFDGGSGTASLERPLDPPPRPGARWRARDRANRRPCEPPRDGALPPAGGRRSGVFVWDVRRLPAAGDVLLRVTPFDAERGRASDTGLPRPVALPLDVEPVLLGDAGRPSAFAARDLDADGLADLAVAGALDALAVYFQRPRGVLGVEPAAAAGGCAGRRPHLVLEGAGGGGALRGVAAADLDGDGDADLAAADASAGRLLLYLQDEPGALGLPRSEGRRGPDAVLGGSGAARGLEAVLAADLDGDGDVDLACTSPEGHEVPLFLQEAPAPGEGSGFRAEPAFRLGRNGAAATASGPFALAAGDLDSDGDADLAVADFGAGGLQVFLQRPGGRIGAPGAGPRFEPDLLLGDPEAIRQPRSIALADLDGDGDLDIASANREGDDPARGSLALFRQEGPGAFSPPDFLRSPGNIGKPLAVAAGDVDSDGSADLVAGSQSLGKVLVLLGRSAGTFGVAGEGAEAAPNLALGGRGLTGGPRALALEDLDGDADLDVAAAAAEDFAVAVFLQRDASGGFGDCPGGPAAAPLVLGSAAVTRGPASAAAGDLDGDGSHDLVAANETGRSLAVLLQKTPRKLEGPLVLSSGREGFAPRSVETADLDGDARLDLLAADAASDRLVIFRRGRGAGEAWEELPVGGGDATRGPRHAAAADLDADGDLDLASANAGGDDVAVFLQEGPWAFGREDGQGSRRPHAALGGPSLTRSPAAVALADLDRDGALDLVVAGEGEPDFARHRFPGSGLAVFLAPGRQLQAAPAPAIEPDLLVGASGETRGCAWVEAADLDSDGSLDLAAAEVGGSLAVFLQDAAGVFRLAAGRPTLVDAGGFSEGPVSVDSADLDRDGRLDLVSSNEFAGDLAVFHQRGRGQFPSAPDARLGGAGITSGPKRALAIDLDGDADPDLVAASSRADSLAVFWGGR